MTLSIPDGLARRFQVAVPARHRSKLVTKLLEKALEADAESLEAACRAANNDPALARETEEWQAFDDGVEE